MKRIIILLLIETCGLISYSQNIKFRYDNNGNFLSEILKGTIPKVKTLGDSIFCQSSFAKIEADGADTYKWSTGSLGKSISVLADSTRTYSVIGYTANGCSDTAYFTAQVAVLPKIDSITGKSITQANGIDTFTVPFNAGSFYSWSVTNGVILDGNGTNKIIVQWNDIEGQGTIQLIQSINNNKCQGQPVSKAVAIKKGTNSIAEITALGAFNVYPNPSTESVWVDFKPTIIGIYTLSIISIDGKEIHNQKLDDNPNQHIRLDEALFPVSGTYIIKITSETGTSIFRRINTIKK